MPVIYTCEKAAWKEKKTHFDTNHLLTIIWDMAELKSAEDALTATVRATFRADAKQADDYMAIDLLLPWRFPIWL